MSNSEGLDGGEDAAADPLVEALHRLDGRLQRLEAVVAGVPAAGAERERAVAGALDSLTSQLNQFTATLVEEVRRNTATAVEAGVGELRATAAAQTEPLAQVRSVIAELAAKVDLGAVTAPVLDRTAVLLDAVSSIHGDLESLALGVRGIRDDVHAGASATSERDRLEQLEAGLAAAERRLSVGLDGLADVLAQVAAGVAGLRAETSARVSSPADELDRLAAAITDLTARPAATVDDLRSAIDTLTDGPAPVTAADLAPVLAELGALAARREPATGEEIRAALTSELSSRGDPATVDDLRQQLDAFEQRIDERLASGAPASMVVDLGPVTDAIAELAARPLPVTTDELGPVAAALGALRASSSEELRGIAAALDELRARPGPDVDALSAAVLEVANRPPPELGPLASAVADLSARPVPATAADLAPITAALAELRDRPGTDLSGIQTTLDELRARPAPPTVDDLAAALASVSEQLAARPEPTPVDLAPLVARIEELVARPVPDLDPLHDLSASVASIRADLASLAARPTGTTPDDLRLTADRLDAALGDVRDEVRTLRTTPDTDPAVLELTAQLDAVGRVLQDVLASLHRIEDGTVGSNPRRERSRQSAIAAVGDLRAAWRRRTEPGPDEPSPDTPASSD